MPLPSHLLNKTVYLTNSETKRFLFSDGDPVAGGEGGWTRSPKMQAADANYYNRAQFTITQHGSNYMIKNNETKRLVFSPSPVVSGSPGDEGGWKIGSGFEAPTCLGADANYYNHGLWSVESRGECYIFKNVGTGRLLFADGSVITRRAAERGWKASSGIEAPDIKATDANYYNRALWMVTTTQPILPKAVDSLLPDSLLNTTVYLTNAETHRFLFADGAPITGPACSEGGWTNSPVMKCADANYYNHAQFTITKKGDNYLIRNNETKRLVFSAGDVFEGKSGDEKGWKSSSGLEAPKCVGVDADYYGGAQWTVKKVGDCYIFRNVRTQRLLFSDGSVITKRGAEGGWKASSGCEAPDSKGTDANYYNRAYWGVTTTPPELKAVEVKPTVEPVVPEPEEPEEPEQPADPITNPNDKTEVKFRITRKIIPKGSSGSPAPFKFTVGNSPFSTEIRGLVNGETRVISCESSDGSSTLKMEATGTENRWNGFLVESVEVLEGQTWVKMSPENVWVEGSDPPKSGTELRGYPNAGKTAIFKK